MSVIGEDDLDFVGLTKESLIMTWTEVFESYFTSKDQVIPYLPLHQSRTEEKKLIQTGHLLCHIVSQDQVGCMYYYNSSKMS